MPIETRTIDVKARISLPKAFTNTTVIIEQLSDAEVRIRKALVIPKDEIRFYEESARPLSNQDRDLFLAQLGNPPQADEVLRQAAVKHAQPHG